MISGNSTSVKRPSATSANTRLSVSSVLAELTCIMRTARIIMADNRKRFSILSPAEYTSSDRMCAPILSSREFATEPGSSRCRRLNQLGALFEFQTGNTRKRKAEEGRFL